MKKQLLIIGCYLDTDIKKQVLRKNIDILKHSFDILLSSHYTIDEEIQKLVDYTVYDSNNDVPFLTGYITWAHYGSVYVQHHIPGSVNVSYAVYQLIRNPLPFIKTLGYDTFFYMEGDLLISEMDVPKILDMKYQSSIENKSACFFKTVQDKPWWDCQLFYSEIDFFLHQTPVLLNFNQFENYCNQIGSDVFIEAALYHMMYMNQTHKVKRLDSIPSEYLKNSQLNITGVNTIDTNNCTEIIYKNEQSGRFAKCIVYIMRMKNTNRVFLIYLNLCESCIQDTEIVINDLGVLHTKQDNFMYVELLGNDEIFHVKVLDNKTLIKEFTVSRDYVLNGTDDYIEIRG